MSDRFKSRGRLNDSINKFLTFFRCSYFVLTSHLTILYSVLHPHLPSLVYIDILPVVFLQFKIRVPSVNLILPYYTIK